MSKSSVRNDKTCLNCQHVVEKRFCANCGQENTETRKSFHHLFSHFLEDLVHYDGAFWKTIKTLLFRPAILTKDYLAGKRKLYVPPVKLYIFINFLAFFLLSTLSTDVEESKVINKDGKSIESVDGNSPANIQFTDYKTVKELDSAQAKKPLVEKFSRIEYWGIKKLTKLNENHTKSELYESFKENFLHTLPKVLFIYMPFFAFLLWLIHGKKRWYYFDHGIFTLHYFSFLLLTFSFFLILNAVLKWCIEDAEDVVGVAFFILSCIWIFYFFRSHRRMYCETRLVSRLKSSILFIVNLILIFIFILLATLYIALSMH